ncbi:MAG TPA: spore coat protein U domain-containing protein [Gallionellaceae bacterium]
MKSASILLRAILGLGTLALLAFASTAQARVTCVVTNPATLSISYGSLYNLVSGSFSVKCTNNTATARTATYQLQATVSANATGTQRRAKGLLGGFLNYSLTTDSACLAPWNATTPNYNPVAAYTTPALVSTNPAGDLHIFFYYVCVPAGQTTLAADTYSDTIAIQFIKNTVSGGTVTWTNGAAFTVLSAKLYGTCSFTTPPGNMTFNYTSMSATAATASTTFATTCTNTLPYTMALDATSGTINGVNYTLALSAASATGTGVAQTYTINGNIAAGQTGTCATATCTGSQARTITITY